MLIKSTALEQTLLKNNFSLYVVVGNDPYLFSHSIHSIKAHLRKRRDLDEKNLQINSPTDWSLLTQESHHYSLFAECIMLDIHYEKKTLDNSGKKCLQDYLETSNDHCVALLRAYQVSSSQLAAIAKHPHALIAQASPLTELALKNWIKGQLQTNKIHYESSVPDVIQYYTQGNMLACAQTIEKISLIHEDADLLTVDIVKELLTDQCDYQLFELADACHRAKSTKVLHLLRHASQNKTEPTLILWLIAQEIRLLIQLSHLLAQAVPLSSACNQLKIWPQRAALYEATLKRLSRDNLQKLLVECQHCDEQLKSTQNQFIWDSLEKLALKFSEKALTL